MAGLLKNIDRWEDYKMKLLKSILIPFIMFTLLFELPEILVNGTLSGFSKSFARVRNRLNFQTSFQLK